MLLVRRLWEVEILEVLKDCDGNKSLSPYGFNFKFINKFWHLLGGNILKAFDDFLKFGALPRGSN